MDWQGYADDLVLLFDDTKNLQLGLEILNTTFNDYHLEINITKTKTMIMNFMKTEDKVEYPDTLVYLNDIPIENVKTFVYLGCMLKYDEPTTGDTELNLRIDTATNKFYELGKKFMNHRISLSTRVKVFNSLVRSRMTYGCQTWTLTKRQASHINARYVSMLRRMVSGGFRRKTGTYHYVITNTEILKRCCTENLIDFISRIQRNYIAHVIRKDNFNITKRVLFNSDKTIVPGKRINVLKTVIENEKMTLDMFNTNALARKF